MKNSEIMILTVAKNSMTYSQDAIKQGMLMSTYFEKKTKFIKVLANLTRKINSNIISRYYNKEWTNGLENIKVAILIAHPDALAVTKYINRVNPQIKVHIWYNNPVRNEIPPENFRKLKCKLWTFDHQDSLDYNLLFNAQYVDITPFELVDKKSKNKEYDISFIGTSKGRMEKLIKYDKEFKKQNLSLFSYVIQSKEDEYSEFPFQKEKLTFDELIKIEARGTGILEIMQDGQKGISLRPLDALFLERKLITDNDRILNEKFYNSKNIFIIGKDDMSSLKKFMNQPFEPIDNQIKLDYTFSGWVQRFNT